MPRIISKNDYDDKHEMGISSSDMSSGNIAPLIDCNLPTALCVKRHSEYARIPTRATPGSAGYDLYVALPPGEMISISPGETTIIPTDISISLPRGTYGRIAGRSGLATKNITVGGGVIDPDYRGKIGVILMCTGKNGMYISGGDRIAQLILESYVVADVREVTDLDATIRGDGGFGSTGK